MTLLVGLCSRTAAFGDYTFWGYDLLVNRAIHQKTLPGVVIVDFDDETFRRINQYPIPRSAVASAISRIADRSPRVIGLDLFLAEPRAPEEDEAMSAALVKAGNVVLASQAGAGGIPAVRPQPVFCHPEIPDASSGFCKDAPPGAFGYAAVNLPVDSDGFIRSFFLFAGGPDKSVSFPLMIAQLARQEAVKPLGNDAVRFLGRAIPTTSDSARRVLIGDWAAATITHIPAISLLEKPDDTPREIAGNIVLIGQSSDAARDLMLTPVFRPKRDNGPRLRLSGVEIHALAIETLLMGSGISVQSPTTIWSLVYAVCVASLWLHLRYSLRTATIGAIGLSISAYVAAQAFLDWGHGWFQYTTAICGIALTVPTGVIYRFVQEKILRAAATREREQIMALFGRYVSPEVAEQIWDRRDEVVLAGEERSATVLFSDIRSFTALTAGKPSSEVLQWLNEYLTTMDEVIRDNGGFLNKFIGDGIMVLFGVPLSDGESADASRAMRCAVRMQERVEQLNASYRVRSGRARIKIGIGLHTGKLTCGSIGSQNRVEYSVIGETVNLASRLEGMTKGFDAAVVMSAATYRAVRDEFPAIEDFGEIVVRGFVDPIRLYGLRNAHQPQQLGTSASPHVS